MNVDPLILRLREVRLDRGLSQEGLAALAGVGRHAVERAERGEAAPTLWTLRKVARALDLDLFVAPPMSPSRMRQPRPCGTPSAYDRHRVHGEEPCEPCRAAYREYHRERKRAKRALRDVPP